MEKEEVGMTEEEKDKEEGGRGGGLGRGRGSGRKGVACGRRRTTDQVVLDDGQDRGEAGKVGDNRKSRTSAEEGGRETRGVRDGVLGSATRA